MESARSILPFQKKRFPFLIKSAQNPSVDATEEELEVNAQATSMRQAAEWGMRSLQSAFPRLKDRFIYEENGERRVIMTMMLLLHNLRARRVGINQIKTVYMSALNADANELAVGPLL